ncbi:Pentatricopeptide repeat-containing protein, chloroplastic, partial [Ananas comosus]
FHCNQLFPEALIIHKILRWVSPISVGRVVDWKKEARGNVKCRGFLFDVRSGEFSYVSGISSSKFNPKVRLSHIKVHSSKHDGDSRSVSELSDKSHTTRVSNARLPNLVTSRRDNVCRKKKRNVWNRVVGIQKPARQKVALSAIGPNSGVEMCNSVLKHLAKISDEKTLDFFERMKSNGKLTRNADAYRLALRALARREEWCRAESLIQEMVSLSECEVDIQVFNPLIYVCAKRGNVDWGTKWFNSMLERGVEPNVSTIGMLMNLYQKSSDLSQAEYTFSLMRSYKLKCVNAYSSMITIYTRSGLYAKSEEIINLMRRDEVIPNLENWLVQLNAYSQQGKLEEAEAILKSMIEARISPNIVAYNTLITGYGKISNANAAKSIFQQLECIGLVPDETTYRSMIEGFGRADNYKEAMFYYEELKRLGFHPSSSNFSTIINLQARHGDEEGVVQTIKDMRASKCQFSSMISTLLRAYERVGRMEKLLPILELLLREYSNRSYVVLYLVTAYVKILVG